MILTTLPLHPFLAFIVLFGTALANPEMKVLSMANDIHLAEEPSKIARGKGRTSQTKFAPASARRRPKFATPTSVLPDPQNVPPRPVFEQRKTSAASRELYQCMVHNARKEMETDFMDNLGHIPHAVSAIIQDFHDRSEEAIQEEQIWTIQSLSTEW